MPPLRSVLVGCFNRRLAAYICGYTTVTIIISGNYSLSNFREDLQKMYKRAGLKSEGLMFLITDSQVGRRQHTAVCQLPK